MSTSLTQTGDIGEGGEHTCDYCGDDYNNGTGGCCDSRCYHTKQGEKALNTIRDSHVWCSSCGRVRAEVTPPKPDEAFAIDNAYGAVYNTDGETVSFEAYGQQESAKAAIGFRKSTPDEVGGFHCVCGTIERTGEGHFDILNDLETFDTLLRIHQRIKDAAIDGQREDWPSKAALFRTYRETEDLAYSVGVALNG